jgi:hypothetical protein
LLLPDGRVANEGLASLITLTNCKVWFYADDDAAAEPLVGLESGLRTCALPSLEWMLDNAGQERYVYNKTYEEAKYDEVVIVHTSGTTGELNKSISMQKVYLS